MWCPINNEYICRSCEISPLMNLTVAELVII